MELLPHLGDACDPDPCGDTHIEERHVTRGPLVTISVDEVQIDAIAAAAPLVALNGLRFCRCELGRSDHPRARIDCQGVVELSIDGGCVLNDTRRYDRTTEERVWRWMSVEAPALPGAIAGAEAVLTHAPPGGVFVPDLVGRWRLYDLDAPRWSTLVGTIPEPIPRSPNGYAGVLWTHTPGTPTVDFDADTRERTSHYLSGFFPPEVTLLALPAGGCFGSIAPYAGAFDWHGRLPFVGRNCGAPDLPVGFAIDGLVLAADIRLELPDLDLLGQPPLVVAVSEPSTLLSENGLRYAALGESGELLLAVDERFGQFVPRAPSCPNCPPCQQCAPIGPMALARGADSTATLETIPVLSARREALWLIESGTPEPARLLTRFVDEQEARDPIELPELGRVLAAVYSPREDVIWLLDERDTGSGWRGRRVARLIALQPDLGTVTTVATWPRLTQSDRFALALAPDGGLYLVSGIGRLRAHAVVRLNPSLADRRVRVLGVRVGVGAPVPGMARANRGEVAFVIEAPGRRRETVREYPAASFVRGGIGSCL